MLASLATPNNRVTLRQTFVDILIGDNDLRPGNNSEAYFLPFK